MSDRREWLLRQRRELLVATASLQRAQLGQDLRHAPWMPALRWARGAWRLWRLVRSVLRR